MSLLAIASEILCHLSWEDPSLTMKIVNFISESIDETLYTRDKSPVKQYLKVIYQLIMVEDRHMETRSLEFLNCLLTQQGMDSLEIVL